MKYQKPDDTKLFEQYEYVVTPEGVTIVGFEGDSDTLHIPESISVEGREEKVVYLAPYAFHNHRELTEIFLPDSVEGIGYHCFFDCRNLEKIRMSDAVREVEDGAFKNCENLARAEIRMMHHNSVGIKGILREQNRQIEFTILHDWKEEDPAPVAKLVMPMYQLDFEANVEARIINQITYGSGIHYRECVTQEDIDYAAYDRVFAVARLNDTMETLTRLSTCRLLYPYLLTETAKQNYLQYLEENLDKIVRWACEQEQMGVISALLLPESPVIRTREQMKKALDIAYETGKVKSISYLLEAQRKLDTEDQKKQKTRFQL